MEIGSCLGLISPPRQLPFTHWQCSSHSDSLQGLSCLVCRRDARFVPAGKSSLEFRPRSSSTNSLGHRARSACKRPAYKQDRAGPYETTNYCCFWYFLKQLSISAISALQCPCSQTIRNFLAGVCKELPFSCSDNPLWSVTAKRQTAADGKKFRLRIRTCRAKNYWKSTWSGEK